MCWVCGFAFTQPTSLRWGDGIIGPFRTGEIANPDSLCMQADDDAGVLRMACCGRLGGSGGAAAAVPLGLGAGVPWPGASAGWWTDHPSVSALGKAPGLGWGWKRRAPRLWAEQGARVRRSRASETPQGWWIGLSKRRAAVGDDRAGRSSCPSRYQVRGQRARAWTPCSSFSSE
jgi:hypothetical protein